MPMPLVSRGALASGTPLVVDMQYAPIPSTVTLKSSAGGRLIELSTDGGVEYFTPSYDKSTTTMAVLTVLAPVSHVRLTGAAGDAWVIL